MPRNATIDDAVGGKYHKSMSTNTNGVLLAEQIPIGALPENLAQSFAAACHAVAQRQVDQAYKHFDKVLEFYKAEDREVPDELQALFAELVALEGNELGVNNGDE